MTHGADTLPRWQAGSRGLRGVKPLAQSRGAAVSSLQAHREPTISPCFLFSLPNPVAWATAVLALASGFKAKPRAKLSIPSQCHQILTHSKIFFSPSL